MIIGLCGRRGSGKSTVAKMICDEIALLECDKPLFHATPLCAMIAQADPMKNLLLELGATEEQLYGSTTNRETLLAGTQVTVREALQTLGTQWGRNMISPNIWILGALARASGFEHAVISDIRFENEARAVVDAGGKVIKLIRRGRTLNDIDSHDSERCVDEIPAHLFSAVWDTTENTLEKTRYLLVRDWLIRNDFGKSAQGSSNE